MKKCLLLILFLYSSLTIAQIRGRLTSSQSGEAIPYASITVINSPYGTSSNENGEFYLPITEKGSYTFIFRSLGYQTKETTITINEVPFDLNTSLNPTEYLLKEVVIESREDQANAIIKNAIEHKKINTQKTAFYEADFYSRGIIRINDVPEEILGQEVGNFSGTLDSTRSGVLYLSETVSRIRYKRPYKINEVITASKVSGDDNGMSYNNAYAAEFDFYENYLPFETSVISPLAGNAFNYYSYKLENTFNDKSGHLINKIKVTPKRDSEPTMYGYIYIVNNSWELYAVNLSIKGLLIDQPLVDILTINQNFGYNSQKEAWVKNVQIIDFNAEIFDVGLSGRFSAVYSNINFDVDFKSNPLTNKVLDFEQNANSKSNSYWNKTRPIPLTQEEKEDYIKKDSLEKLKESPEYIELQDRKKNKFLLFSLPIGYTYYNTDENWKITFSGLARKLGFNTVQAYHLAPTFTFTKTNPETKAYTTYGTNLNYGFAEKRFRANAFISHKFNNISNPIVTLSGGSSIEQFNPENPINRMVNSVSTLFFRDNYMKLYDVNFIKFSYEEELVNGIEFFGSVEYNRKRSLFNNTNFSTIKNAKKPYTSNNPLDPEAYDTPAFEKHNMIKTSVSARFTFGQKYMLRPHEKINLGTKYPRILLKYEKGFASSIDNYNFDHLSAKITYDATIGNVGDLGISIRTGQFFNSDSIAFTDYRHFNGNQTHVGKSERYLNVFNFLPYYTHSTNDKYLEAHAEYNFKGYLANKVPLFNKLNYYLVTGYHVLGVPNQKPYMEFTVGLDNLGWDRFRFLRIDYIRSYDGKQMSDGVIFGLTFLDILE
ncbi:carboxypeptidase-like regulatory domain-containing protein [Flavobacterium rakeshii]|uniref:Carboxypeptidase-like regulatory domain-containing protein n=1 Tax=Flavobacterium rakeshii TaxID=1038845 RepID=A0A6N8HA96_9FLAO|nr:DUF5686 and carboxypeptidase regulatory-like domain-containing protein [Flavobacterium rakeshii]MUV03212.1 carboxypeptidase-like regulatory domain-containing protein [Flavobacterium rakeshii]